MVGCYPTSTMFDCIIVNLSTGLNIDILAAQFIVGFAMCIVFVVALYRATGAAFSIPLGLFIGLAFTLGAGIMPSWIFIAIMFLVIMGVAGLMFGGPSGDSE